MDTVQRIAGGRKGRWAWGALALLLGAALAGTFVAASRAAERARADAADRATRYAETVLFENLDPSLAENQILGPLYREGTILGPKYRVLLIAVQDAILIDPLVTRVRIWDSKGLLIFSTDTSDSIGSTATADEGALAAALEGGTVTTLLTEHGRQIQRTVTPLRIPGKLGVAAVAGIDQDAGQIAAEATAPWARARIPLAVLLAVSLGFVIVALARPEPPRRAERPSRAERKDSEEAAGLRANVEELRAELERMTAQLDRVMDERDAARAQIASFDEMPATTGAPLPADASPEELRQLRETLEFALKDSANATTRASVLETELSEAEERARLAEERVRELEGAFSGVGLGVSANGSDVLSEEQLRAYELTLRNAAVRELRGPVSRVRGVALSLKQEVSTANGRDLVQRLSLAADKLDRLVADLESLSRLVDGSLPLQRWNTELDRFVDRVVSEWRRETDRTVLIDLQPVSVPVDQARVRQVLEGLLDDASARTGERETLKVKVRAHDEGATLAVEEPNDVATSLGSRGDLQLAIVQRLVELHGGRIWHERYRDSSSAVFVLFPNTDVPDREGAVGAPTEA
jgi:signal transduction histidine kinase